MLAATDIRRHALAAFLLAGLFLSALTGGASAATIGLDPSSPLGATYRAGPGEANDLTMLTVFPSGQSVSDAGATVVAGAGCTAGTPILCTFAGGSVYLRDGNDRARVRAFSLGDAQVFGGRGDDDIAVDNSGGGYAAFGGRGNDRLWVASNGIASAKGGRGNDVLGHGGDGGGILAAGDGDDLIAGALRAGRLSLEGGDGRDALVGTVQSHVGEGSMSGGPDNDVFVLPPTPPLPTSPPWSIDGGRGDDYVALRSDASVTVAAGPGDDIVDANGNPGRDSIVCGAGRDTVYADVSDVVDPSCEKIVLRLAPPCAAVTIALARAQEFLAEPRF